jgi:DNA-binding transcriptional LysR family regulator
VDNNQLFGSMQAFVSVVESGSFSASARRLGLSQPTISRQINALEASLGVRLLQRTTRRLSLTEAGEIYYQKAKQIQREVAEANLSIAGFKETPSGVLRISAPHTWAETLIAPHMSDFLHSYPGIALDIECNDQFQDMIEERLDLVIRVGVQRDSSYVAVPFGQVEMVVVASPDYLDRHGTPATPAELEQHNFVLFEKFNQIEATPGAQTQIVNVSGNVRVNTVPLMLAAARQHMGITVLPDLLVNSAIDSGALVRILPEVKMQIKNLPIDQVFALYSSRKHLSSKARVFLDFFRERLQGTRQ